MTPGEKVEREAVPRQRQVTQLANISLANISFLGCRRNRRHCSRWSCPGPACPRPACVSPTTLWSDPALPRLPAQRGCSQVAGDQVHPAPRCSLLAAAGENGGTAVDGAPPAVPDGGAGEGGAAVTFDCILSFRSRPGFERSSETYFLGLKLYFSVPFLFLHSQLFPGFRIQFL